jgi:tetratricopeptide (TPR) repeat protein
VKVYRERLAGFEKKQTKPDGLAAMRLAEHVLEAEGKKAFVDAFVYECYPTLSTLGLLDATTTLSERALKVVKKGSAEEAAVLGNLGIVYKTRGELDKAEEMHKKSLEIAKIFGMQKVIASEYAHLGLIYRDRGDIAKARDYWEKAVELFKKNGMKHKIEEVEGWIDSIDK